MFLHSLSASQLSAILIVMPEPSVEHLAHLARIALSEEEKIRLRREFSEIVSYVGQVQGVPGVGKPLISTLSGVQQVLREDAVVASELADQLLRQAPSTERGQVKVPGIL